MTIDEAIKLLQRDLDDLGCVDILDLNEAQQLGIAALVRIKTLRNENGAANYPLVGETGDETLPIKEGK